MKPLKKTLAVIPARYASSRFPGKPLAEIDGKPMIQHVWEQVRKVKSIHQAIIATDDLRIKEAVEAFGGQVQMTSPDHRSGTDRVWEVAQALPEFDTILNIQGDEPFLDPNHLEQIIDRMNALPQADIMTLVTPIQNLERVENRHIWEDTNVVKAVLDQQGRILYFSRSPVPCYRDGIQPGDGAFRHLGLYLFRREALAHFTGLPLSPLEKAERLEQLRAMESGISLYAVTVDKAPIGVDTPEDLARLKKHRQNLNDSPLTCL